MEEAKQVIAFAWYQPEEWMKLKGIIDDPSALDDTFEDWYSSAEAAISKLRLNGQQVKKISVRVSDLLDWCNSLGLEPNSQARSRYVAELAQKRSSKI